MNKIGRKIYYDLSTGDVIVDTFERQGSVVETTLDQDIRAFKALSERNAGTFDVIQLPFGAYAQDFAECTGYRVNPETKTIEFNYSNENDPEDKPVFQDPLSVEVKNLKESVAELSYLLTTTATT